MSSITERLDDALTSTQDAPPREGWSIRSLDEANWASRKAAQARRSIATAKAWGQREIERINAIVDAEVSRFQDDADFFEHHLADFLAREIEGGRKTKSLELSGGTIKLTATQPKIEVDEQALILWAQNHGRLDLIRVREALDKAALRKQAQLVEDGVVIIDGEIVPDAKWLPQDDSASFKVAEDPGGTDHDQ